MAILFDGLLCRWSSKSVRFAVRRSPHHLQRNVPQLKAKKSGKGGSQMQVFSKEPELQATATSDSTAFE